MKAKQINESLGFEEDMDPYDALRVGKKIPFIDGEAIKIAKTIYFHPRSGGEEDIKWTLYKQSQNDSEFNIKPGTIMIYKADVYSDGFVDSKGSAISRHWFLENPTSYYRT